MLTSENAKEGGCSREILGSSFLVCTEGFNDGKHLNYGLQDITETNCMRIEHCCKMVLKYIRLSISDPFSLSFAVILNRFLFFVILIVEISVTMLIRIIQELEPGKPRDTFG